MENEDRSFKYKLQGIADVLEISIDDIKQKPSYVDKKIEKILLEQEQSNDPAIRNITNDPYMRLMISNNIENFKNLSESVQGYVHKCKSQSLDFESNYYVSRVNKEKESFAKWRLSQEIEKRVVKDIQGMKKVELSMIGLSEDIINIATSFFVEMLLGVSEEAEKSIGSFYEEGNFLKFKKYDDYLIEISKDSNEDLSKEEEYVALIKNSHPYLYKVLFSILSEFYKTKDYFHKDFDGNVLGVFRENTDRTNPIIYLTKSANLSTLLRLISFFFISIRSGSKYQKRITLETQESFKKGFGKPLSDITGCDYQRFADALEIYLYDGRIPSNISEKLKSCFLEANEKIKNIYKGQKHVLSKSVDNEILFLVDRLFIPFEEEILEKENREYCLLKKKILKWLYRFKFRNY